MKGVRKTTVKNRPPGPSPLVRFGPHWVKRQNVKGIVLDVAPLNDAQERFTTLEVSADWHCL